MQIRHATLALLLAAAPPLLGPAAAQSAKATAPATVEEPRDIVAAIYKLAAAEAKKGSSPFFDRHARETYFSKGFDLLITTQETEAAHQGAAGFDFDPISASQDAEIKKVTLKTDLIEQAKAVVSASFLNRGQPTVVTYDFIREGGEWKINDIKGTTEKEAWSVRRILKAGAAEPTTLPGMPDAASAPDAKLGAKPDAKPDARTGAKPTPLPPRRDDGAK